MFGVGLRPKHYREFLESSPRVDFVEAISENFMGLGGRPLAVLEKVRRDRPVFLHGVSLGIGSLEPLDERYLTQWKDLIGRIAPQVVSDHLCWGRAHGRYSHDLLPEPFTVEALEHVVSRVRQVQDFLGRRIALENVSSYLTFAQSELSEWEFFREVVTRADCDVLLDVNNVFVSSRNHGFDPDAYISAMPVERVVQVHLAGHQRRADLIIDTHDGPVSDEVWALYSRTMARLSERVATLIEWDDAVPPLSELLGEAEKARAVVAGSVRVTAGVTPLPDPLPLRGEGKKGLYEVMFSAICDFSPVSVEAAALIAPHPPLSNTARIEVYAEMYWLRMRDVLRDAFAAVRAGLDDALFDGLVADYLREHPSTHHSLDRLGAKFPAFLSTALPAWADVAALEWARAEAFIAPDAPVVPFSALQAHAPETWAELSLAAHPSLRLLEVSSDPRPALEALRANEPPRAPTPGSTQLVVWRTGFEVFHAPISHAELEALRQVALGSGLAEVLGPFEDDSAAAFTALQSWFSEGMISHVASAASRERAD